MLRRLVMAPKVGSAAAIACAAALLPVASNVQFSSSASLFGAPGQANYAAANAALEANALAAAARGVPSTAVQWGAWAAGMADTHSAYHVWRSLSARSGVQSAVLLCVLQQFIRSLEHHCSELVRGWLAQLFRAFHTSTLGPKVCNSLCACPAGMAADPRVQRQAKQTGMGSLSPVQGLGVLFSILSTPASVAQQQPQFAAMSVDWSIVIKQVLLIHV